MKGEIIPATHPDAIHLAAHIIGEGGLVAFPTETVYGLGCDAFNSSALAKVFHAKRRPQFDPLIVHVADRAMLDRLTPPLSQIGLRLIDVFWPGPLALIVPKDPEVSDLVTAGLPTVAIRMPDHPVASALIRAAGTPIAAPSANRFGYVSPTTAEHVRQSLGTEVDLILDGGPCSVGVESTILSLTGPCPELLRPGLRTLAELRAVIGPVMVPLHTKKMRAPGQLARHYATRTPLTLLESQAAGRGLPGQERAGLLAMSASGQWVEGFSVVEILSESGDLCEAARNLFSALRKLDALGLERLYAEPCEERGIGLAIMDRLRRCAVPLQTAVTAEPGTYRA